MLAEGADGLLAPVFAKCGPLNQQRPLSPPHEVPHQCFLAQQPLSHTLRSNRSVDLGPVRIHKPQRHHLQHGVHGPVSRPFVAAPAAAASAWTVEGGRLHREQARLFPRAFATRPRTPPERVASLLHA